MNIKYFFDIIKILISIELYLLPNKVNSKLSFTYPYAITLSNGNIFIVHKFGIDIYDPLLSKLIKKILIFSDEEQIETENDLSKLILKYEKGFIISIIKDKIYIFSNDGDFLYRSNNKITEDKNIEYYTLVSLAIREEKYFFLIGFFDVNNSLNLLFYKYYI